MKNYKHLYKKIKIYGAGSKSAPDTQLIPPDRTNAKESYSVSQAVDLISEGPIEGLVDKDRRLLRSDSARPGFLEKKFNQEASEIIQREVSGVVLKNFEDKFLNTSFKQKEFIGVNQKSSIDTVKILLILDQTGSQEEFQIPIAEVFETFIAKLRAGPFRNISIALFGFNDPVGSGSLMRLDYTQDIDLIKSTITNADFIGGGDANEPGMSAVNLGLQAFPGAEEVILLTDNPASDPQFRSIALQELIRNSTRCHISLFSDSNETIFYETLASGTGGTVVRSTSPVTNFTTIVDFITNNARSTKLISFTGANYGMSKETEIFEIYYDGRQWLITNFNRTIIYWKQVIARSVGDLANTIPTSGWERVSGTGEFGQIINYKDYTIDRGVFFDETQLKTEDVVNYVKYKLSFRDGSESQGVTDFLNKAVTLYKKDFLLQGAFISGGSAVSGTGNTDQRRGGDFAGWRNYTPERTNAIVFTHEVRNKDTESIDISISVDQLSDTIAEGSGSDAESGNVKIGRIRATTISFQIRTIEYLNDGTIITRRPRFTINNTDGRGYSVSGANVSLTGITTAPYVFTIRNVLLPAHKSITVTRSVSVEKVQKETLSQLVNRQARVISISERNKYSFTYPHTALIATELDARTLDQIPNRTFSIKGKKILIPSNYFPTDDLGADRRFSEDGSTEGNLIYDGPWDGTFKLAWSDNPAWILYDLLTSYRYGTAIYNREIDKINIWSLFEIGKYCDAVDADGRFVGLADGFGGLEPRYSFNHALKDGKQAYDVIKDISKSIRAFAFYQNSQIKFRIDMPEETVFTFNNLNVRDGLFTYSDTYKSTRVSAIDISFLDKRNNYRPRTEYAEDEDSIQRFGYKKNTIAGFGVTSRAQALRTARAALFEANNTTETVSFEASFEALFLEPGDIIEVNDELRNISRNYGKILGASGFHEYPNGPGFTAILTDKDLINITGSIESGSNITLYSSRNTSSSESLYDKKRDILLFNRQAPDTGAFISNEEISGFKNPQISKFQLDTGSNFVEEFDDHLLFKLNTGQDYPLDQNDIFPNTVFSLDISGRDKKLYKVLNVSEDDEKFYQISAISYHTGKYDYIDTGANFNKDDDNFEISFKRNIYNTPNRPTAVTTGAKIFDDLKIDMPLNIVSNELNPGDQYSLFLEKPNGQSNTNAQIITNTGLVTTFNLQDLTQIGQYDLQIFSKISSNGLLSSDSINLSFNLTFDDFSMEAGVDNYLIYKNIVLNTIHESNYATGTGIGGDGQISGSGSGFMSFSTTQDNLVAELNLDIVDFFGDSAINNDKIYDIDQRIDLLDSDQNIIKSGFKTLENVDNLQITTGDLLSGFGYTGDGRYRIRPTLDVEIGEISGKNFSSGVLSGDFAAPFTGIPVLLFNNQFVSGQSFSDAKPLSIRSVSESGFNVLSFASGDQDYKYTAISTGDFQLNENYKTGKFVEVRKIEKTGLGFQQIDLSKTFNTVPNIFIQSQNSFYPTQTYVTGVTKSGFSFDAINSKLFPQTGDFGYLAIDTGVFNINNEIFQGLNYSGMTTGDFLLGTGDSKGNVFKTGANINNAFSITQSLDNGIVDTFSTFNKADEEVKLIKQTIDVTTGTAILTNGSSGVVFLSGQENVGSGDFSIFFNLRESTTGKSVIISKFLNSGFEVFSETGDLKLHLSDTNGNSGVFDLTTGVGFDSKPGQKNHYIINVDRDFGVTTFVNGQENLFNTGITGVTGILSNDNELSFFGDNRPKDPDHGYSLFNLNGNSSQFVVDVAKHGTNLTGSFTANDIVTGKLLEFVGVAGTGTVSKLYDQFGDKDASQTETGNQPTIVSGGAVITLAGKPAMQFTRSNGNQNGGTVLNIKTGEFGSSDPGSALSRHVSGVNGLEIFALASFDTVVLNSTNKAISYQADYILGENYNGGKRDFAVGARRFGSDDARLYLYHERDQDNTFGGFSIDEDTDITKDGFGYSGNIISVGNDTRYLINGFAGLNTTVGSGFIGIGTGSEYVSGFVSTGRNNYIVGTIGSDQTYDESFQGKLQELLFYTSTFGFTDNEREKVKSNINKKLAQSSELDYLTNEYSNKFTDYIGVTKDLLTQEERQNTQFITGVQSFSDQLAILDLVNGTGELKKLSDLSEFITIKNNISNANDQTEITSIEGTGDFSFITITGNLNEKTPKDTVLSIVEAPPSLNFTGDVNNFDHYRKIFSVTGQASAPVSNKISIASNGDFLFVGYSADEDNAGVVRIYNSQNGADIQQITGGLPSGRLGSDLSAATFFDKTVLFIGNEGSGKNHSEGQIHMFHEVGSEFVSGFTKASGSGIGNVLKISNSLFTGSDANTTSDHIINNTGVLVARGAQDDGATHSNQRTGVLFIDKIIDSGSGLLDMQHAKVINNPVPVPSPFFKLLDNNTFENLTGEAIRVFDPAGVLQLGFGIIGYADGGDNPFHNANDFKAIPSGDNLVFGESFDFNDRYLLVGHRAPVIASIQEIQENFYQSETDETVFADGFVQIFSFTGGNAYSTGSALFTSLDRPTGNPTSDLNTPPAAGENNAERQMINPNAGFAEGFNSISINDNNISAIVSRKGGISKSGVVNIHSFVFDFNQFDTPFSDFVTGIDLAKLGLAHSRMTKLANEDYTSVKITNDRLFISAISGNGSSAENDGAVHIFKFSGSGSSGDGGFTLTQSITGFSTNFGVDISTGDGQMLYVTDRKNNTVTAFKDERLIII